MEKDNSNQRKRDEGSSTVHHSVPRPYISSGGIVVRDQGGHPLCGKETTGRPGPIDQPTTLKCEYQRATTTSVSLPLSPPLTPSSSGTITSSQISTMSMDEAHTLSVPPFHRLPGLVQLLVLERQYDALGEVIKYFDPERPIGDIENVCLPPTIPVECHILSAILDVLGACGRTQRPSNTESRMSSSCANPQQRDPPGSDKELSRGAHARETNETTTSSSTLVRPQLNDSQQPCPNTVTTSTTPQGQQVNENTVLGRTWQGGLPTQQDQSPPDAHQDQRASQLTPNSKQVTQVLAVEAPQQQPHEASQREETVTPSGSRNPVGRPRNKEPAPQRKTKPSKAKQSSSGAKAKANKKKNDVVHGVGPSEAMAAPATPLGTSMDNPIAIEDDDEDAIAGASNLKQSVACVSTPTPRELSKQEDDVLGQENGTVLQSAGVIPNSLTMGKDDVGHATCDSTQGDATQQPTAPTNTLGRRQRQPTTGSSRKRARTAPTGTSKPELPTGSPAMAETPTVGMINPMWTGNGVVQGPLMAHPGPSITPVQVLPTFPGPGFVPMPGPHLAHGVLPQRQRTLTPAQYQLMLVQRSWAARQRASMQQAMLQQNLQVNQPPGAMQFPFPAPPLPGVYDAALSQGPVVPTTMAFLPQPYAWTPPFLGHVYPPHPGSMQGNMASTPTTNNTVLPDAPISTSTTPVLPQE